MEVFRPAARVDVWWSPKLRGNLLCGTCVVSFPVEWVRLATGWKEASILPVS